jgi:hypothetical protein
LRDDDGAESQYEKECESEDDSVRAAQRTPRDHTRAKRKREDHGAHCRQHESGGQHSRRGKCDAEVIVRAVVAEVCEGKSERELRNDLDDFGERFVVSRPAGRAKAVVAFAALSARKAIATAVERY